MELYDNIMDKILKLDWMVKDYKKVVEHTFWVFGSLSNFDCRYLFKYSLAQDIIRLNIIYYFGTLRDMNPNELMGILLENTGSYYLTSAYFGLELSDKEKRVCTTFNTSLFFMTKQEDQDIAELISCALMDIESAFINIQLPDSIITFVDEKMGK